MSATRSKMGASIQGCADANGVPEGWPVSVTTQPGETLDVNIMGGGGGAVTIADGADVNSGSTTDAAVVGDSPGTISAKLRGISRILDDVWDPPNSRLNVAVQNTVAVTGGPFEVEGRAATGAAPVGKPVLLGAKDVVGNLMIPPIATAGGRLIVIGGSDAGSTQTFLTAGGVLDALTAAAPVSLAFGYAFNGTSWDRVKTAPGAHGTTGTGLLGVSNLIWDGTSFVRHLTVSQLADAITGSAMLAGASWVYNGTNWDRTRAANGASATTGTGLLGAGNMVFDGTNWQKLAGTTGGSPIVVQGINGVNPADADTNSNFVGVRDASGTNRKGLYNASAIFNGTTWDRIKSATAAAATTGTGLLGVGMLGFDGTNYQRVQVTTLGDVFCSIRDTSNAIGDAFSNTLRQPVNGGGTAVSYRTFPTLFNETTWDRVRGNTDVQGLASAARTTTQTINGTNYNGRGISVILDMTAIGAGATWTVSIDATDGTSGKFVNLLTGAAVAGNGTTMYRVYPGLTAVANVDANGFVPRSYRVQVTVGGTAASSTFSLGIQTEV